MDDWKLHDERSFARWLRWKEDEKFWIAVSGIVTSLLFLSTCVL